MPPLFLTAILLFLFPGYLESFKSNISKPGPGFVNIASEYSEAMSDDEWYGTTARLYDKNGFRTHVLGEAAYVIRDPNLLRINSDLMLARIHKDDTVID